MDQRLRLNTIEGSQIKTQHYSLTAQSVYSVFDCAGQFRQIEAVFSVGGHKGSQKNYLMISPLKINCVKYPVHKIMAVPREERSDVQAPFLQSLFRIEQIKGMFNLTMHSLIARDLCPVKTRAQPIDLIINLPASLFQRVCQRGIDSSQLFLQA